MGKQKIGLNGNLIIKVHKSEAIFILFHYHIIPNIIFFHSITQQNNNV
jgi:hypothetical protein